MAYTIARLDNFYEVAENAVAQQLFSGVVWLRRRSYGRDYPASYLALNQIDFIASHQLICEKVNEALIPVAGYRSVQVSRLNEYSLPLTLLEDVERVGSFSHVTALRDCILSCMETGRNLIYGSNFALCKDTRADKRASTELKELLIGLMYAEVTRSEPAMIISGATLRFKVDDLFRAVGYVPLEHRGRPLNAYSKLSAGGEAVLLMKLESFSDWARCCFERYRDSIESMLVISKNHNASDGAIVKKAA